MNEFHNKIFNYLRSNYPDLTFVLRKTNRYRRLEQGYWFMGGHTNPEKEYLCVSFWDINDNANMTPKIYLQLEANGKALLILVDKDSSKDMGARERAEFFKKIAPVLKVVQTEDRRTGEERDVWIKEYNNFDSQEKILDYFVNEERILIDTFIDLNNKRSLFEFVSISDFQNKLTKIAEIKYRLNINTQLNTEIKKWNTIVLEKLTLKNIGHFDLLDIDFNFSGSKRVAVFYGENGIGKSTILQSISIGLAVKRDRKTLEEEQKKREDKSKNESLAKLLRIERIEDNINHYSTDSFIELRYNKQYKNTIRFNCIEENDIRVEADEENTDYKNFKVENDSFLCLVKGFSQHKKVELDKNLSIKKSEEVSTYPITADLRPLIYQFADDSFKNFENWITDAATNSAYYNKIKPALNVAFDIIKTITSGDFELMPLRASEPNLNVKTTVASEGIPIDLISDGYKNVIGWIGDFTKRLFQVTPDDKKVEFQNTYAVCLIDEIDTYLHPKWQRTILKTLADTFKNTHFIVTTHSPLVITSLPKDLVTVYHVKRNNSGKIEVLDLQKDERFIAYGSTVTYFLKKAMDIQSERPEIDALLRKYRKAIEQATVQSLEEAEKIESEIELLINEDDPELSRLRTKKEVEKQWLNSN